MITNINGDLLIADVDIIAHQTNCKGVMGSGVPKQIADKYPSILPDYVSTCTRHKDKCLGNILYVSPKENRNILIANLFWQNEYGGGNKVYTNFEALKKCFISLANIKYDSYFLIDKTIVKIAIPYKIGCHRGGEDWNKVYDMIYKIFGEVNDIDLQIWKYNK